MNKKFFLIGLPASGKTTFARKLADEFHLRFIDLDEEITRTELRTIPEIFEQEGEDYFRKVEKERLEELSQLDDFALATGGGTPCFFDNMELMNEIGITIYLDTPKEEIQKRLEDPSNRPMMQTHTLDELIEKRVSWYGKAQYSVSEYSQLRDIVRMSIQT